MEALVPKALAKKAMGRRILSSRFGRWQDIRVMLAPAPHFSPRRFTRAGKLSTKYSHSGAAGLAEMLLLQSERTPTLSECLVQAGALDAEELERERRLFRLLTVEESSHTMIRSEGPRAVAT